MNYKREFFQKFHDETINNFISSIDDDIRESFNLINFAGDEVDPESEFQEIFENALIGIKQMYNENYSDITDMFYYKSDSLIKVTLNYILTLFMNSQDLTFDKINELHFFDFIIWTLITQNDQKIISTSLVIFQQIYLIEINSSIINSLTYIIPHLFSENLYIQMYSIATLGDLFEYSYEVAINLIQNEDIISRILEIASENEYDLPCNQALIFLQSIIYHKFCNQEFSEYVPLELVEKIILIALPNLARSRPSLTINSLKILQNITLVGDIIPIANEKGLEQALIKGLNAIPKSQISYLYIIIRNILNYAQSNGNDTNIPKNTVFFQKTAELLKDTSNTELSDIILTTIDILGSYFWSQFLEYNVLDTLISIIEKREYKIKKHICSILLHFFKDVNLILRRKYCTSTVIEIFLDMFDDDDSGIIFEIIQTLSILLFDDIEHFRPLLIQYDFVDSLSNIMKGDDKELAILAESVYNNLP